MPGRSHRPTARRRRFGLHHSVALTILLSAAPASAQQSAPVGRPAEAPRSAAPAAARSSDQAKPIEIQADRLEVDQEQQLAIFSGNVDAVQGELSLRADRLRVFYTDEGERQAAANAGGNDQGIRRIEAEGNVLLTQPGETAEGDAGVYDPIAGTLILRGNVVLTRGQNVIRGARLDSNLDSGVSVVTAAGGRDRRVRALFVPDGSGPDG